MSLTADVQSRFRPALSPGCPPPREGEPALWFVVQKGQLLVKTLPPGAGPAGGGQPGVAVPEAGSAAALGLEPGVTHFLGRLEGQACWAAEIGPGMPPGASMPSGASMEFRGLRSLLNELPEELFALAGRASQIIDWGRHHRYCGACGAATRESATDRSRQCPACGLSFYPRISPAVIMAVTRGPRLLLAANRRHKGELYSVLAGFVEPGESLEQCVHREIREEVGIEVSNVRYFGSQPWPFPNSLMIAFTAEHAAGEIEVDGSELVAADWFEAAKLPRVPDCGTIARRMINAFVESTGIGNKEPKK